MIARLHCRYDCPTTCSGNATAQPSLPCRRAMVAVALPSVAVAAQRPKTAMQPGGRALVLFIDDRPVVLPLRLLDHL
jgi:hypothetical protein